MAPVTLPPGFRFHPTDEELVAYYLKRKINGRRIELEIIPEVDLYKCEPWDLPEKSFLPSKDLEWYFFSPRDRKYPNGSRTNRATRTGYWKATGKDRQVHSQRRAVGTKKTLVYYRGRAPHGSRTDWVMHEYCLDEKECENASGLQDAYALCRVLKRSTSEPEAAKRYGAPPKDHSQWISSDQSSGQSISGERGEDLESCPRYPFPQQAPPSGIIDQGNSFGVSAANCTNWMQFFAEEAPISTSLPFQNATRLPCLPFEMDIAMECARLQHRFSLPPLEVDDFPKVDYTNSVQVLHSGNYEDDIHGMGILREILSLPSAPGELAPQSNWTDIVLDGEVGDASIHQWDIIVSNMEEQLQEEGNIVEKPGEIQTPEITPAGDHRGCLQVDISTLAPGEGTDSTKCEGSCCSTTLSCPTGVGPFPN
ncbi:hypothetical protein Taro_051471 [Colocasia esculenta]|uniref:NAC domain-containing protein n=1 Tax=Colocasia esculenta TaxID=4460 RepID=A0A843XG18_COLES|nr:hypothetical protein [Colocasia esculenta]